MYASEGNMAVKIEKNIRQRENGYKYKRIFGRFHPPMRIHTSALIDGKIIINDSGATCADATYYSLRKIHPPIVWIVWNDNTDTPFEQWDRALLSHVQHIIVIGRAYEKLQYLFGDFIPVTKVETPAQALTTAMQTAGKGQHILISHATPKPGGLKARDVFDLFEKWIKKL